MELLSPMLLSELVADDLGFFGDRHFNPFESTFNDLDLHSFSSDRASRSYSSFTPENRPIFPTEPVREVQPWPIRMTKRPKIESPCDADANLLLPPLSNRKIISFGKLDSSDEYYGVNCDELKPEVEESYKEGTTYSSIYSRTKKRTFGGMSRTPLLAQDHVLAERKRREKLSRLFISLSALIPGLKKLDKASVLEDAIKNIKELQGRVKMLEEDLAMNSAVSMKSSGLEQGDSDVDCATPPIDGFDRRLPEVEARVSDNHVLLRIHCEKHQGRIINILSQIEKLHLTILSYSVLPFGNSIVDVTVVAEMNGDFSSIIDDLDYLFPGNQGSKMASQFIVRNTIVLDGADFQRLKE